MTQQTQSSGSKTPTKEEQAIESLQADVTYYLKSFKEWSEKFLQNPWYELQWSADQFKAAADLELKSRLLNYLRQQKPITLKQLIEEMEEELLQKAARTERSTSVQSNEMSNYEREVLAQALKELKRIK